MTPPAPSEPFTLPLEFHRARNAADPFTDLPHTQVEYIARHTNGTVSTARFPWSADLRGDLDALESRTPDRAALQRLGDALGEFLRALNDPADQAALERACREGQPVRLTIRSSAAELLHLPWELTTLESGQHLGELPGCLVQYEFPRRRSVPRPPIPAAGRVLFAWSAEGGLVPADKHLAALRSTCANPSRKLDEIPNVSLAALEAALSASTEPILALHLLCHGGPTRSGDYALLCNSSSPGGDPDVINAAALRHALEPHVRRIGMVVLSACQSANAGSPANHLGSVTQALHRLGIPVVVGSRFPLSTEGSVRMTEALYRELLVHGASIEQAVLAARNEVAGNKLQLDWASIQLYASSTPAGALSRRRPMWLAVAAAAVVAAVAAVAALVPGRSPPPSQLTAELSSDTPIEQPIGGHIYDSATNEGVPDADIYLPDYQQGGKTNAKGDFWLAVIGLKEARTTLRVNKSGFEPRELTGTLGNTTLGFSLTRLPERKPRPR